MFKLKKALIVTALSCSMVFSAQSAFAASEVEPNNSITAAQSISINTNYFGTFSSTSDKDWYKFTISTPGDYQMVVQNPSGGDYYIVPWKLIGGTWTNIYSSTTHLTVGSNDITQFFSGAGEQYAFQIINRNSSVNLQYNTYVEHY
ncbi:hypothetical protein [Paenibacillus periandrae]|uniref:hypothetical protein n=1 Tax=Paenibacillus periandrae TaxID=1761741 RepID=UPI001F08F27B|nr:hypothetical protein [Paenibacillus periandrae]